MPIVKPARPRNDVCSYLQSRTSKTGALFPRLFCDGLSSGKAISFVPLSKSRHLNTDPYTTLKLCLVSPHAERDRDGARRGGSQEHSDAVAYI